MREIHPLEEGCKSVREPGRITFRRTPFDGPGAPPRSGYVQPGNVKNPGATSRRSGTQSKVTCPSALPPRSLHSFRDVSGLAKTQPAAAWEYLQTFGDEDTKRAGLSSLANAWAKTGVDAALDWAGENLVSPEMFEVFEGSVLVALAEDLPAEAARRFADLPYSDSREADLVGIISEWAQENGQAAATWAVGLRTDAAKQAAIRQLMETWTATNAREPWEWINTLPSGDTRDFAVEWYIRAAQKVAPEIAVEAYLTESGQLSR